MSKLGILVGAGVGYVLGARAGHDRYDQIKQQARRVWSSPRVQQAKDQAGDLAQEKGAQVRNKVQDKVQETFDKAAGDQDSDTAASSTGSFATPSDRP